VTTFPNLFFEGRLMPQKIIYTAIASGSQVSSDVDLSFGSRLWAIAVPSITSGDLLPQGALDTTSAGYRRILDTRGQGSGDLRFATGPGSRMVMWPSDVPTPPKMRLETSVVQALTNVATFALLVR
jgi:hypothetical protein